MSRSRRIKCKLCNVRSEKTRQVHGYEKQNRQEAWKLQLPVAFLSFSFYDLMQFLSKSQVRDNFHELNGSVASLGRKVAAVTFYVCDSLSFDVSICIYIYLYINICLTTMHIV